MKLQVNFLHNLVQSFQKSDFDQIRLFIIQHLYQDTLDFVRTLGGLGIVIDVIIGIPYSNQREIVDSLKKLNLRVITPKFEEMDQTVIKELKRSLNMCEKNNQKLLIHEVGGYAVPLTHSHFIDKLNFIVGAVEDTKQGKWRVEQIDNLAYPYFHCAESRLKRLEAAFVGDAVVFALDNLLRGHGFTLAGRKALVIGYGWIGKAVCSSLSHRNVIVTSYDTDAIKRLTAHLDGYQVVNFEQCPAEASIVIGACGQTSVTKHIIERMHNNTIIASASSRDIEIDLPYLRNTALQEIKLTSGIREFKMQDDRKLYLINNGYPINFLEASLPDEIATLMFGEIAIMIHKIATEKLSPGIYSIDDEIENEIAAMWLSLRASIS